PASPDPEVATAVTAPDVVEEAARDLDPLATRGLVPGSPDEPASSDTWSGGGVSDQLASLPDLGDVAGDTGLQAPGAIADRSPVVMNLQRIEVTEPPTDAPREPIARENAGTANLKTAGVRLSDPSPKQSEITSLTLSKSEFQVPRHADLSRDPTPVQTATLSPLNEPLATQSLLNTGVGSPTTVPSIPSPSGGLAPLAQPDDGVEIAALPNVSAACATPPALTLDIQPGARTEVVLVAPCYAERAAELSYSGLTFAIPLDASGNGSTLALGFEATSPAEIRFNDGEIMSFDLPFSGAERISRVALSWELPVELGLHALEFNAERGDPGDVSAGNPRSYAEIRRTGGGFLTEFVPADGAGQFVQIYSHLVRRNGRPGVVDMYVDFVSRDRDRLEGTCGQGDLARPQFVVMRSEGGRVSRPFTGRLASLACDELASGAEVSAASSVGTLVISP
ncbi:MAG: hypothetical protein AAF501_05770, partial [Pseudomonadota bacterium]